jgi:ABC-type glycerol-3-phosphate transport system substrate-binding protein
LAIATPERAALLALLRQGHLDGHLKMIGADPSTYADLLSIIDPLDGSTMAVHTTAALGDVIALSAAGNVPGAELGVLPLPVDGRGSLAGGSAMWIVERGAAAANGAAFAVAQWLSDPERIGTLDAATGYLPPTHSAAASEAMQGAWEQFPQLRVGFDQLAAMPNTPAAGGLVIGPDRDLRTAMATACTSVVVDGADPLEALNTAQAAAQALLDDRQEGDRP